MLTRKLGYTEMHFTTVGLGTWAMGGEGWQFSWGHQDDQASIAAIHRALDLGINWIDTAAIYGLGHAEEIVAQALKGLTKHPYLATKCGRLAREDNGALYGLLTAKSIRKELESSLRRLQVETIDLYQIHWPDPDAQIEEGWSTMSDLVKEGKIRYPAVSNFNLSQLKRLQSIYPVASLQPPYNMLKRDLEGDLLDYCASNKIGVVAYSPMSKGLLTDKFTRAWVGTIPASDHRQRDPNFREPLLSHHLQLLDGLREIATRNNRSLAQLSIAWTLRNPAVTSAIVGARRPEQIEETATASDWQLAKEDINAIEILLRRHDEAAHQSRL